MIQFERMIDTVGIPGEKIKDFVYLVHPQGSDRFLEYKIVFWSASTYSRLFTFPRIINI